MARRRISVERIKDVIRYGVTTDLSERAIGRALKVSRTAVANYLEYFRASGLTWEQAQELPDSKLLSVLEGNRPAPPGSRAARQSGNRLKVVCDSRQYQRAICVPAGLLRA